MLNLMDTFYSFTINIIGDNDTPEGLENAAKKARKAMSSICLKMTDEEFKEGLDLLRERISVHMSGQNALITSLNSEHFPWISNAKATIKWEFWDRYRQYLLEVKKWPKSVVNSLDDTSDSIIDLLGDPRRKEGFLRKGLIIGDVQSGKTATYTSICNKAADAGYQVIIVLTGIQEDLRQQTQKRLDSEFAGVRSADVLNYPGKHKPRTKEGVAKYGDNIKLVQFTSTLNDFDISIARNIRVDIKVLSQPILFVLKKQKDVLKNLFMWLEESIDPSTGKIMHPMLLIDDEADNASINTNDADDPTTINHRIRDLMSMFNQVSYLGVTATPFANIFIQPELDTEKDDNITATKLGQADLYPSDFIYSLDTPTNYIGARRIFGDDESENESGDHKYFLQEIDSEEMEEYLPYNHKKDYILKGIPSSLKQALYYFLIVNAIQDFRKQKKTHRSMMIHTSRFINVQNQLGRLVNDWLHDVVSEIRNFSALPDGDVKIKNNMVLSEMENLYQKMDLGKYAGLTWSSLRKKYLYHAVAPIVVRIQNGDKNNKEALDYQHHPEGLRVIAIGGNSFSRGLTLEGLSVTFFYRRSMMYDTLLQMGRWFGYRPGYEDLCRIWLSSEAIRWYRYITDATEELKDQIREMQRLHRTPNEFGLKVRQNPASLIVTARNKMKNAHDVKQAISIAGRLLESPRLVCDENILKQNYEVFKNFISMLPPIYTGDNNSNLCRPRLFWRGIKSSYISQLLQEYQSSTWHLDFQGPILSDYISIHMKNELWDVVIVDPREKEERLILDCNSSHITVYPIPRPIGYDKITDTILINNKKVRIGSVGLTKYGLKDTEVKRLNKNFHDKFPSKKAASDKVFLQTKRNPILFIYFIRPTNDLPKHISKHTPLCALGLGFPGNGSDEKLVQYKVNIVAYQNMIHNDFNIDEVEE